MCIKKLLPSGRGRLLRLKLGYNPNSSSIGSYVFVLPAALLGLTALFGAVVAFLQSAWMRPRIRAGKATGSDVERSGAASAGGHP